MDNPIGDIIKDWQTFYSLAGAASATLIGLLFIAASLHLDIFTDESDGELRSLAEDSLINFFHVLITALIFLVPHQTTLGVSVPLIGLGALGIGRVILGEVQHARKGLVNLKHVPTIAPFLAWGVLLPLVYHLTTLYVAIAVLDGNLGALDWLVGVNIAIIITASMNAWNMMVRLATYRRRLAIIRDKAPHTNSTENRSGDS